eukprot:GHVO01024596.1.p1 GENE.GHVO01024596.1~~GHVO01024596.1.p1  ORF type:complete len:176 (-),score=20.99 GHVO01024596.1:46-573(-)
MGCHGMPLLKSCQTSTTAMIEPAKLMAREGDGASKEKQLSNVEESSSFSLIRLSSVIAQGKEDTSKDVDVTQSSADLWVLKSSDHQDKEECRVTLERILMSPLNAVELIARVRVHCRVRNAQPLPCTTNIDGHPHVGEATAESGEDDIAVAGWQDLKKFRIHSHVLFYCSKLDEA